MSIQWFPGHMTKAKKVLAESMPKQDLVIEVLDARMPRASANPLITELRTHKPCIKVLSKTDLADPAVTAAWIRALESTHGAKTKVRVAAITTQRQAETRKLIETLSKQLVARGPNSVRPIRAMIVGVPNVGKSTLINTLKNRKVAKVGDEPAVTKSTQIVELDSGMVLTDHPGLMWPDLTNQEGAYRLAIAHSIPSTAIDFEEIALFAGRFFMERYPKLLEARYGITERFEDPRALLEAIGRRRGSLRAGGIDIHKAADVLLNDFRSGKLGRISLESPEPETPTERPIDG